MNFAYVKWWVNQAVRRFQKKPKAPDPFGKTTIFSGTRQNTRPHIRNTLR